MARVNRAIELLEQGQPIYYSGAGELSYEGGVKASRGRIISWLSWNMGFLTFRHWMHL